MYLQTYAYKVTNDDTGKDAQEEWFVGYRKGQAGRPYHAQRRNASFPRTGDIMDIFTLYVVETYGPGGTSRLLTTADYDGADARYRIARNDRTRPRTNVRLLCIGATGGRILRDTAREHIIEDKRLVYEDDGDVIFNTR